MPIKNYQGILPLRLFVVGCLVVLCTSISWAQSSLRGTVSDAENGQPLVGATVVLDELKKGTTTDSLGNFSFAQLSPGRYPIRVTYLGYQAVLLAEVLVTNGKETVLAIELTEASTSLQPVTVKSTRTVGLGSKASVLLLTQEETFRYPATFNDPARMATAYAGISGGNDQGNLLIIRGQSPLGMSWRLEGLEIVNPNHTPNAGTFTDRTTLSAGGVNALSAQLLSEAPFFLGNMPASYGNATAGLLDMRLRPGNNQQREFTVQAGVIGLDVAAEGPLGKKGASYLVNYRYSFTGLLADLGVPLGDEDIRFQDLSFNLTFPGKNGQSLNIFGLLGASSNEFIRPEDTTEWESDKYLYETIDFESQMGTVGFNFQRPQGKDGKLIVKGLWSGLETTRRADPTDFAGQDLDDLQQQKYTGQVAYQRKLLPFGSVTVGVEALVVNQSLLQESVTGENFELPAVDQDLSTVSAFLDWRYRIKKLFFQLGYRHSFWEDNSFAEPRLRVQYTVGKKHGISLEYHQSTQTPSIYSATNRPRLGQQTSLSWEYQWTPTRQVNLQLFNRETEAPGLGALSEINQLNSPTLAPKATTIGNAVGVALNIQQLTTNGWWYVLSGSLFDATYETAEGDLPARFAQDFTSAFSIGKEWIGQNSKEQATRFGLNLALRYNGGLRQAPILLEASRDAQRTIFDYEKGFTEQLPNYFRTDFRLYFQRNRAGWNSLLSLDIQNVTNQQNAAYQYYDRYLDEITTRYQLELIPVLSYKLEF